MRFEDGILYLESNLETVNLTIAKRLVEQRKRFVRGQVYPIIVDYSKLAHMDRDSRVFLSEEEACEGILACAFLTHSPVQKMIGNFFIKINPPSIPFKTFSNKTSALQWLEQFKKKDKSKELESLEKTLRKINVIQFTSKFL